MNLIWKISRGIRHAPLLKECDFLWDKLRAPFHRFLALKRGGIRVCIGGSIQVEIPAELTGLHAWEHYEPETVTRFCGWIEEYPNGLVLDIGCAVGVFSAIALQKSKNLRVVAFDGDLASLKATQRLCSYLDDGRLSVVHGLITNRSSSNLNLDQAILATNQHIREQGLTGEVGSTRYVCLDGADKSIPQLALDDLLVDISGPLLLKCDVEGAEELVLRGFENGLSRKDVDLLLSIHPGALPSYKSSRESIQSLLKAHGFLIDCFAIDHEEHWYCSKK